MKRYKLNKNWTEHALQSYADQQRDMGRNNWFHYAKRPENGGRRVRAPYVLWCKWEWRKRNWIRVAAERRRWWRECRRRGDSRGPRRGRSGCTRWRRTPPSPSSSSSRRSPPRSSPSDLLPAPPLQQDLPQSYAWCRRQGTVCYHIILLELELRQRKYAPLMLIDLYCAERQAVEATASPTWPLEATACVLPTSHVTFHDWNPWEQCYHCDHHRKFQPPQLQHNLATESINWIGSQSIN